MPALFERNLDGELVKVTGILLQWIREADATVLMLRAAGKVIRAHVPGLFSGVEPGSSVEKNQVLIIFK